MASRSLLDVEGDRIRDMDESGVDMQIPSLTWPDVQIFNADTLQLRPMINLPRRSAAIRRALPDFRRSLHKIRRVQSRRWTAPSTS